MLKNLPWIHLACIGCIVISFPVSAQNKDFCVFNVKQLCFWRAAPPSSQRDRAISEYERLAAGCPSRPCSDSEQTYVAPSPPRPTYSAPSFSPPSGGGGGNAGEVLEILGTFLDIWGNAQQQEAQRAQEEYQRSQAEQRQLEEEEEERRAQQLEDSRKRQAMTNPFTPSASPGANVQNPFARPQANREAPGRGAVAANPFRTEMARESSSSGIPKEQCISDLQRALLATKKAYLSNTKSATTLNDKSIAADFEIPRSSCPPVSKVNVYEQRRTFEDARALQYCASQALKCAIVLVDNGADCQISMSSCQTKFVGNLK